MTAPSTRALAAEVPAAVLVGALSAAILTALSALAGALQDLVWTSLPDAWGLQTADGVRWWWTVAVLTLTGLLVGATLRWAPGHGGQDPATTGLVATPLPLSALPGLALALVLGLAGGVSLGPENPIIALNVALAVWFLTRRPDSGDDGARRGVTLATAGTIGALFATPVAAALVLTEVLAEGERTGGRLFDRLFSPLVAAGTGALTMTLIGAPTFSLDLPPYDSSGWDLLSAPLVAIAAALLVAAGAALLPLLHRALHSVSSPVVALGLGGLVLGILGAVGGEVTLFKGLDEMKELADTADERTWTALLLVAVIKVAALLTATAAGFRGGRIFPSVFIGVALGLAVSTLVPAIPATVAVGAATMGAVIAVDRDGWIALFLATITVGDVELLPLLCLTLAPLWLLARLLPEFRTSPPPSGRPEFGRQGYPV
jgi:H+/Cl- antiporter ClcA